MGLEQMCTYENFPAKPCNPYILYKFFPSTMCFFEDVENFLLFLRAGFYIR